MGPVPKEQLLIQKRKAYVVTEIQAVLTSSVVTSFFVVFFLCTLFFFLLYECLGMYHIVTNKRCKAFDRETAVPQADNVEIICKSFKSININDKKRLRVNENASATEDSILEERLIAGNQTKYIYTGDKEFPDNVCQARRKNPVTSSSNKKVTIDKKEASSEESRRPKSERCKKITQQRRQSNSENDMGKCSLNHAKANNDVNSHHHFKNNNRYFKGSKQVTSNVKKNHNKESKGEFKCVFCQKIKKEDNFSPFLMKKYHKKPTTIIQCLDCSSACVRTHLVCFMCSKRKPLNKFSKVVSRFSVLIL